ncbi:MAG: Lrp/AsnC family transcriptional regulator [archaeon]
MKNIAPDLLRLFREGYCTPQIARIARKLKEPSTTIHYNIKKLEREGVIRTYKAVLDHSKIEEGFCVHILINLSPDEYGDPERLAKDIAKHPRVESVDICTGDWELLVKTRAKDQEDYFAFVKQVLSKKGIAHVKSIISLKQVKSEFTTP